MNFIQREQPPPLPPPPPQQPVQHPPPPPPPPPPVQPPPPPQPPVMTFNAFKLYIANNIDPNGIYHITSEILLNVEKPYIEDYENDWIKLTRDDKRHKETIFRGLYKNVNLIHQTLQNNPGRYLRYSYDVIRKKYKNK